MPAVAPKIRWDAEMRVLLHTFPQATRIEAGNGAYRINIPVTTNAGKPYVLRIYTAPGYPDVCPTIVVANPSPLRDKNGQPMRDVSSRMHTLGTHDGFTEICHFQPSLWDADYSLQMVAMKGRMWLEAYEGHLSTGQPIDQWLPHMRPGGAATPAGGAEPRVGLLRRLGRALGRLFG